MESKALSIPAGMVLKGTEDQTGGNWINGSLVRFEGNSFVPIGGWTEVFKLFDDDLTVGKFECPDGKKCTVRSMMVWTERSGVSEYIRIAYGACSRLIVGVQNFEEGMMPERIGSYHFYDLTPDKIGDAIDDPAPIQGYGAGIYGQGFYGGTPEDSSSYRQPISIWSFALWGRELVACVSTRFGEGYGRVYKWDLDTSTKAVKILNSPEGCVGVVCVNRFVLVLGKNGDGRTVSWCDRENITVWDPSYDNEAGDIKLDSEGELLCGINWRSYTLLLTTEEAVSVTYQGPPYVFGFEIIGSKCGAISQQSAVSADDAIYWMGNGAFYRFDGISMQTLQCSFEEDLERDINFDYESKIHGMFLGSKREVIWFYTSDDSSEVNKYVALNTETKVWTHGYMDRTAFYYSDMFENPIGADYDSKVYWHEKGYEYPGKDEIPRIPYLSSGPIYLSDSESVIRTLSFIVDYEGDENENGEGYVQFRICTSIYPNQDVIRCIGPYKVKKLNSVRITGRTIRILFEAVSPGSGFWRVGNLRFRYVTCGDR